MITFSNYDTEITKIPINKAPEIIQKGHAFFGKSKELYSKSDAIKKTIDLYLTKLNFYAGKDTKEPRNVIAYQDGTRWLILTKEDAKKRFKQNKEIFSVDFDSETEAVIESIEDIENTDVIGILYNPEAKSKKSTHNFKVGDKVKVDFRKETGVILKVKNDNWLLIEYPELGFSEEINIPDIKVTKISSTSNKSKSKTYSKIHFTDHVKLAKRFVGFIGKPKTLAQVENLHKAVQKAVIEGNLPTTEYFKIMVEKTPKMLAIARKAAPQATTLEGLQDATEQTKLVNFANAATKWPSVNLIKRYIAIANTTGKVDAGKITRLETSINNYVDKMNNADPFAEILKKIAQKGINSNAVTDFRLSGLPGEEIPNLQGIANYLGSHCQNINFTNDGGTPEKK